MSGKAPVEVVGAMSGTSLDGVDAALIRTDGHRILGFGRADYRPYEEAERATLRAALGRWEGAEVAAAAEVVETAHAELLSTFPEAALFGVHGQTLAHDPRGRGTLQVGDGRILAEVLDRPVVWDFRSMDVEAGGEGAPLAPFFHHAAMRHVDADAPVAVLNLGGVGNLTWLDPRIDRPEAPGACLAFDTGPANAPVDDLMRRRRGLDRDVDGALAASGKVADGILEAFLDDAYFYRMPPKSLDREAFAALRAAVEDLSDADAAATLTAAAAAAVMRGVEHCPAPPVRVLVTGGGRHNRTLMEMIRAGLDCPVDPVEEVGLDGDMLEAQAFGYLAVRVLRGLPTTAPGTTGVPAPVGGGRISRPGAFERAAGA